MMLYCCWCSLKKDFSRDIFFLFLTPQKKNSETKGKEKTGSGRNHLCYASSSEGRRRAKREYLRGGVESEEFFNMAVINLVVRNSFN